MRRTTSRTWSSIYCTHRPDEVVGLEAPIESGARASLLVAGTIEDIIRRALRLGCRVNQKPAIVAEFLQPAGDIGGLIWEDGV